MKQVYSSKNGIVVKETPEPEVSRDTVKIRVAFSCISAGTEMSTIKASNMGLLQRVMEKPQQVMTVLNMVKEEGLKTARNKVDARLNGLMSSGYSVSGVVVAVGVGVDNFKVGDFVSAGGAGIAQHQEYVVVPKNLVVHVPEGLNLAYASMGTVGSIAMHGVRRAGLTLGEYGVVIGCGLMGLLAIQMMKASGVKVACTDINPARLRMASELGADKVINSATEDPVVAVHNWTNGYGADAILFTAATHSDEPLSQSFQMCRRKGKVVLLGVSGMNIKREDIYKNEIDFCISTSYGPGRYDPEYEKKGIDYPYAYVRWTENRNIYSFLELVRDGKINIDHITPKIYPVDKADDAFGGISSNPSEHIITILDYGYTPEETKESVTTIQLNAQRTVSKDVITIGLIGAGNFAKNFLLPIVNTNPDKFYLKTVVNRSGDKALNVGRQYNAAVISSDNNDVFNDPDIDLVMICTGHGSHADLVLKGLKAGKHVYVEKPLATTIEQLDAIKAFYTDSTFSQKPSLMVGFNRRFSKYAREIKKVLDKRSAPALIHYRMNAGFAPADVWVHNDGGRIIGEGCHLIDLMQYLIGEEVTSCSVSSFKPKSGMYLSEDNRSISMEFTDGSVAVIDYFSCGNKELPKEFMEVHFEGKSIIMDDYQKLIGFGVKIKEMKESTPKKGHKEEWLAMYDALKKGESPIALDSILKTTELSILAAQE